MKRVLIILILLIFISSCDGTQDQVITGGIDFSWVDMPTSLANDVPFRITIQLTNNMLRDVDTEVCLQDLTAYGISPIKSGDESGKACATSSVDGAISQEIDGKTKITPGEDTVYFPSGGDYYYHDMPPGTSTVNFLVGVGYTVDTILSRNICLFYPTSKEVSDGYSNDWPECTLEESGGWDDFAQKEKVPVTVDNFEKSITKLSGNRIILELNLHLTQTQGVAYVNENEAKSSDKEDNAGFTQIEFNLGGQPVDFDCGKVVENGRVRLINGERDLSCKAEISLKGNEPYQETLNIILNYYYKVSSGKSVDFEAEPLYE